VCRSTIAQPSRGAAKLTPKKKEYEREFQRTSVSRQCKSACPRQLPIKYTPFLVSCENSTFVRVRGLAGIASMRKLIAAGGGDNNPGDFPTKGVFAFDEEIVTLAGRKKPRLLFIPTATKDWEGYIDAVEKYFGGRLGCRVDVLRVVSERPSADAIKGKILNADIIYVGGGNTLFLIRKWKQLGIDKLLRQAYARGAVMSGLSAGAICWFRYGTSDSRMLTDPIFKDYIRVSGLGWFDLTLSPHHFKEKKRKSALIKHIRKHGGVGLALDDYAAVEILDNRFRIITAKPFAKAFKAYKRHGEVVYEELPKNTFLPLAKLVRISDHAG
jgi:dipeptidase E